MRRYVTIGGIVLATVLVGSAAAYAGPEVLTVTSVTADDPGPTVSPAPPATPAPCPATAPPAATAASAAATSSPTAPAGSAAPPAPAEPAPTRTPAATAPATVPATPTATPTKIPPAAPTPAPAAQPARPASTGGAFQAAPATEIPDGPAAGGDATSDPATEGKETAADHEDPEDPSPDGTDTDGPDPGPQGSDTADTTDTAATPAACAPAPGPGPDTSAATKLGWGTPSRVDNFDGALSSSWGVYDGSGHNGAGRRTPGAITVADGVMTMTGDAQGNSGGMAWQPGQRYGRWEGRVRSLAGDPDYHAVMLLWPDAENWPVGGEVDFMEISDPSRQNTQMFLHYGADNQQVQGSVDVDATRWHDWAVEWTPTAVTAYVDGKKWWSTTQVDILPPGPMHLCIQLDNFGGTSMKKTSMQVDWVKEYKLGTTAEGALDTAGRAAGAAGRTVDGATRPLTEGAPDPVPAVSGLVPHAVPVPSR